MRFRQMRSAFVYVPALPALMMPMSSQIRCICGDSDKMAHAFGDLLLASGAHVSLHRFVRLYATRFNGAIQLAIP